MPHPDADGSFPPKSGWRRASSPTLRAVLAYKSCDDISGWLIYLALIFSPWAFGTTQPWSIRIMNLLGYALGLLLLIKLFVRKRQGYLAPRWGGERAGGQFAVKAMAGLTIAILAYCLISALNYRSTYDPLLQEFSYHSQHIAWLPHSYDRVRSWQAFINYFALACFFWAIRDWLLGKSDAEVRSANSPSPIVGKTSQLPERLRRLLWILSLNGGLLGVESIAQRLSGTNQLLWIQPTRINADAQYQFGPYAYRSNAAQYFNLVWPAALALWWVLGRELGRKLDPSSWRGYAANLLLLAAILVMAACPIITLSRAGAIVAAVNMVVAMTLLLLALRRRGALTQLSVVLFFAAAAGLGLWFEWGNLSERMKLAGEGLRDREATYSTARKIAEDFPVYGTGPGTFEPVFSLYRSSLEEYWPKQLHNDWLETRITFGWCGSVLIASLFLLAVTRWFRGPGIQTGWRFTFLLWLALAGCMVHALADFPMQIYSTLLLFLLICAMLTTLERRRKVGI